MKRVSTTLAFVLGAFATFSSAAQIQGFVTGYAPGDVDEKKEANGVESSSDLHSDFAWSVGAEFLAFPAGPLMVGGGLGFMSVQQDGSDYVVMPALPLWGSVGVIGPESWSARPYFEVRAGYPVPVSRFKTWWNRPLNFFVSGNVGVQLPYHMGVEFNYTYLTMEKYFKKSDVDFRLSSFKFGGSITIHFDLFKSAEPSKDESVKDNAVAAPVTEDYSGESVSSDISENTDAATPDEVYSGNADQPAEQPAEEPVAEESVAEESVTETVAEPVSDEVATEEQPAEENTEVAPEDTVAAETPAEEAPVAETPAEEPAAEPVAEPAPAPEKKPAAKKKATKKKTTKKTTKKKSTKKKSTKKKTTTRKKR